jgi:hypothetical protein
MIGAFRDVAQEIEIGDEVEVPKGEAGKLESLLSEAVRT